MSGYVYFLQTTSETVRFKIGFSLNPEQRAKSLHQSNADPVHLLGYVKGSRLLEASCHEVMKPYRNKGEWYQDCAPVQEFIGIALSLGINQAIAHIENRAKPKRNTIKKGKNPNYGRINDMQQFVDAYPQDVDKSEYWNRLLSNVGVSD